MHQDDHNQPEQPENTAASQVLEEVAPVAPPATPAATAVDPPALATAALPEAEQPPSSVAAGSEVDPPADTTHPAAAFVEIPPVLDEVELPLHVSGVGDEVRHLEPEPFAGPAPQTPPAPLLHSEAVTDQAIPVLDQREAPLHASGIAQAAVEPSAEPASVPFEAPAPYISPAWSATDEPGAESASGPPHSEHDAVYPEGVGDEPPSPVWVSAPMTDAPAEGAEGVSREAGYAGPAEPHIEMPQGGPNWMLAFVCAWAAFTSFMEAPVAYAAKETMINGSTISLSSSDRMYGGLGFALLGLGLLLFGIEALLWGRRRRGVSALLSIGLPVLMSLAGIVCLVLSHYPGSRI